MRITITCPTCNKKSQIDSSLRGKRLRCPYPDCKKPFRLSEAGEAVSLDSPPMVEQPKVVDWQAAQGGGGTGGWDMPAVADWQAAPPPQRDSGTFDAPAEAFYENQEGTWDAPAEAAVEYSDSPAEYEYEAETEAIDYYAPVKKKKHGLVMLIGILIGVVALAGGGLALWVMKAAQEDKAADEAHKEYAAGHFAAAESKFKQLAEKFPESTRLGEYRFMEQLSGFRSGASSSDLDVNKFDEKFHKFYNEYRGKKDYKERIEEIWEGSKSYVNAGLAAAERNADRAVLEKIRATFDGKIKDVGLSVKDTAGSERFFTEFEQKYAKATIAVAKLEARKATLARFDECIKSKLPGDVEAAEQFLEGQARTYPDLVKDNEIKAKLNQLRTAEPGRITYTSADKKLDKPAAGGVEGITLAVCPLVRGQPGTPPANDPSVLSLSRGMLYAKSLATGELRWSLRVGVDTTILPARLPARPPQPEIALVLSTDAAADKSTVIAVNMRTGEPLWAYPLNATCPAGPIVAGRIAYFPTVERTMTDRGVVVEGGKVHEIEAVEGRLMGVFDVGQPLTVPGGFDSISRRLFVPASRKRIYVLDTEKKTCAGVYYTNHTVGGLRAAPIVTPSTLVVAEANSLGSMLVKSFTLSESGDKATPDNVQYRIRGWAWFAPFFDGDTLGYLTDRGSLALFGTKRGTADKSLFPLTPLPDKAVAEPYGQAVGDVGGLEASSQPPVGPAQIAHVDLNEWWLLVSGKLFRYRYDYYRQQVVRAPHEPLNLGGPSQASQSRGQYLLLGTQSLDRSLATAIDRRTTNIAWQRQLGLMTDQELAVLGGHVVAIDRSGGLFQLQASKAPASQPTARIPGPSAGEWLANGLNNADPDSPPHLVASPDGKFAIAVLHDTVGDKVVLRRYEPGKGIVSEKTHPFASQPLKGSTMALNERALIIPCRDGNLRELPLAGPAAQPITMSWRHNDARPDAVCHALFLSDTSLLATDGIRTLLRWERGQDGRWSRVRDGSLELEGRIASRAVIVPGPGGEKLLSVADDGGRVYVVSLSRSEYVQRWEFKGQRVTKGPVLRGTNLAVVLDDSEVVWLDPAQPQPVWQTPLADASVQLTLIGEPQQVGNLLLVGGHFVTNQPVGGHRPTATVFFWLELNGKQKGRQVLKSRVVPSASAVPLNATQAIVPLSDGTLMILSPPAPVTARAD